MSGTWQPQALCAKLAGWHDATTAEQRDACATCPVHTECLADALTEHTKGGYPSGIRGGLTEDERVSYLTGRRPHGHSPAPVLHGTYAGHRQHQRRGEPSCPACLEARTVYQTAARERRAARAAS